MPDPVIVPGTSDEALTNGWRLLEIDPAAALTQARAILRRDRQHISAHRLLASAFRQLGQKTEADATEMQAIRISFANPALSEAARAVAQGRNTDAETALLPFVQANPDDALALLILAEARGNGGDLVEGERLARKALLLSPTFVRASIFLAKLRMLQGRSDDGVAIIDDILQHKPGNVPALRFKARLLGEMGDYQAAVMFYEKLLVQGSEETGLLVSYGDALRFIGRTGDSARVYRKALDLDPSAGHLHWRLADLKASEHNEADIEQMRAALAARPDADNACHLHFALGIVQEAAGNIADSMRHYVAGNDIMRAKLGYDPATTEADILHSKRIFTHTFFEQRIGQGDPSNGPIFIIGMPRSGSTLVEQILSCHPMIEGAGELPAMQTIAKALARQEAAGDFRPVVEKMSADDLRKLGSHYISLTHVHRKTEKPYFIDKLPLNWRLTGLIHMILPNARIIDVRRAPMDCCFSNYKTLFSDGHPASSDLSHMAAYYREYVDLMRHFDAVLPGRIHRIIYEQLIDNSEAETRRLLEYIGVPFDPACLDFHKNARSVATASSEQVRRPMNRAGIDAWRKYDAWLGPLHKALADLPETYAD